MNFIQDYIFNTKEILDQINTNSIKKTIDIIASIKKK